MSATVKGPEQGTFSCAGIAQLARASAFQAEGRGFESRFPLHVCFPQRHEGLVGQGSLPAPCMDPTRGAGQVGDGCPRSSEVEHFLGKEEDTGSSPVVGSICL